MRFLHEMQEMLEGDVSLGTLKVVLSQVSRSILVFHGLWWRLAASRTNVAASNACKLPVILPNLRFWSLCTKLTIILPNRYLLVRVVFPYLLTNHGYPLRFMLYTENDIHILSSVHFKVSF